jgi:5-methyltetrahydrofolate--homocysteine methyltransferase
MDERLQKIHDSVINGDMGQTTAHVQAAIDAGLDPATVLKEGMISAMTEVGRLFEEGEYFVPEMLIAARAMKAGVALLKPLLVAAEVPSLGKVVMGSVKGDLHDIGKNLVGMMLEGAGFEIVDLGTDVAPAAFVDAVRTHAPAIVGMSALLTTTIPSMRATIEALSEAGLRTAVRAIVGGAPVTDRYAREIGADGYAPDASRAVALAKALVDAR